MTVQVHQARHLVLHNWSVLRHYKGCGEELGIYFSITYQNRQVGNAEMECSTHAHSMHEGKVTNHYQHPISLFT